MKLRHIILGEHFSDLESRELLLRYRNESWCSCHYLTRLVRMQKIDSGTFNSIIVTPVGTRALKGPWQASENVNVDVPFDWSAYATSQGQVAVNTLFHDLIKEGFERLRNGWGLPIDQLQEILTGFREGGFVNAWNFKRRMFRNYGLKASLDCLIDLEHFTLTLTVTRGKDVLFRDVILRSGPDPLDWYYEFQDVIVSNGYVVVPKRNQYSTGVTPLNEALFYWEVPET